jgi:large subunit ribosomal protein L4
MTDTKKKTATKAAAKPAKSVVSAAKAAPARPKAARAAKTAPKPKAEAAPAGSAPTATLEVQGKDGRKATLAPEIFGLKPNDHLLYEAVKQYRAGARRGTHMTKNRALVSGSGKKPWKQKGTGQARVGEKRTPLWRHGGTVFGPQPRDYSYAMPKKARLAALRQALSMKARTGSLRIIDALKADEPKTKLLKRQIDALNFPGKTVYVEHEPKDALVLSGRNIPGFRIVEPSHLTVYDVLDCRTLALSHAALARIEARLGARA